MKYCLDANVLITAWHKNYPPKTFPTLYQEMENKLPDKIIIIEPIFDQIEPITDNDLKKFLEKDYHWLSFDSQPSVDDNKLRKKLETDHPVHLWIRYKLNIAKTPVNHAVQQKTLELMSKYETNNVSTGADDVDISLISFAHENTFTVVTLESRQEQKPKKRCKYKIPLICEKEGVTCIGFIELLNKCNIIV